MLAELFSTTLFQVAVGLGVLGVILFFGGILAFMRMEFSSSGYRLVIGLLLAALGGLAGTVAVGVQGYRTFTREDLVAHIVVKPVAPQRFTATFRFPDGSAANYAVSGDEIYVDARILKWSPYANWIGLHTAYELDRVAGRYRAIKDEREQNRTVHSLGRERTVDLYAFRQKYAFLSPLLDAEYGSATYVPVTGPAELELRVSTTGLLMRDAKRPQKP